MEHRDGGLRLACELDRVLRPDATVADLIDAATAVTGEVALADEDLEALDVLWGSSASAPMGAFGRRALATEIARSLVVNMGLRRWEASCGHPRLAREHPIVVVGLPRTGTTYMHHALSVVGDTVSFSEALDPLVRRRTAAGDPGAVALTRDSAGARVALQQRRAPALDVIHPWRIDDPEECGVLLQHSLRSLHWLTLYDLPEYRRWLMSADLGPAYDVWDRALHALEVPGRPARWVLKFPGHIAAIDQIAARMPGAVIVWTHRDPVTAVASWCSLVSTARSANMNRACDERALGREWLSVWSQLHARGLALAAELDHASSDRRCRVLHVTLEHLSRHPEQVLAHVFELAGVPADDELIRRCVAAGATGRNPVHSYTPSQFGLEPRDAELFAEPPQPGVAR